MHIRHGRYQVANDPVGREVLEHCATLFIEQWCDQVDVAEIRKVSSGIQHDNVAVTVDAGLEAQGRLGPGAPNRANAKFIQRCQPAVRIAAVLDPPNHREFLGGRDRDLVEFEFRGCTLHTAVYPCESSIEIAGTRGQWPVARVIKLGKTREDEIASLERNVPTAVCF